MLFHKLFVYAFEVQDKSHCFGFVFGGIRTSKKVSWRHFIAVESLILGGFITHFKRPCNFAKNEEVVGGSKKMLPVPRPLLRNKKFMLDEMT